jgi:hypothetical protein
VQIIQSTKYKNAVSSSRKSILENQKEPLLKGKMKFLNYHLSFIPLYDLNDNTNKDSISDTTINKINSDSMDNTSTQQLYIPLLSQYSTKESTKYNNFRQKINKNLLNITNNNFGQNLKNFRAFSDNKESIAFKNKRNYSYYKYNKVNNNNNEINENEKYKGNIKEKIKDFYKEIKSKGCLSFLPNAQNNTFFMRKFNQKYESAIKKNYSVRDRINKNNRGL